MMEKTGHCAFDTVFSLVGAFVGRSLTAVKRWGLTRLNLFYTESVDKKLPDHSGDAWLRNKLAKLRSEICKFNSVVKKHLLPIAHLVYSR